MKYCANCDRSYPQQTVRCPGCGLPLLEIPDFPPSEPSSVSSPSQPYREEKAAAPGAEAADLQEYAAPPAGAADAGAPVRDHTSGGFGSAAGAGDAGETDSHIKGIFTAAGAAVGAALLLFVICVLIFGVFRDELFGSNKAPLPEPSASAAPAASPSPTDPGDVPASEPPQEPSPAVPASVGDLDISESDRQDYALLCGSAWTDAYGGAILSFFEDGTFISSSVSGGDIVRGEAAVSSGRLFLERDGVLKEYILSLEEDFLVLEDTVTGERTEYSHENSAAVDGPDNLFDYPVSVMDSSSYSELVDSGPWTDLQTGWVLSFYFDNTYLADRPDSSSMYGSAVVSGGKLCMVRGNEYDKVYECEYSLSAGTLTITSGSDSWSLLGRKAYQALLLREQLNTELYDRLVSGSCWYARSDSEVNSLYFFDDGAFALCAVDMLTGREYVIREGAASVENGSLFLSFGRNILEFTVTLEDNLLYLTDASGGGTVTYESSKTFSY